MTDNELGNRRPLLFCDSGDRFLNGCKVYAREVTQDSDLWYQYWIWYTQDRDHVGDWELVQIRMGDLTRLPVEAAYAQHRSLERRVWAEVLKEAGRPVVFPSRGKHASYFAPGFHRQRWRWERANGHRPTPYDFRIITADDSRELSKPGRWGPDDDSPLSPGRQLAWAQPSVWARRVLMSYR